MYQGYDWDTVRWSSGYVNPSAPAGEEMPGMPRPDTEGHQAPQLPRYDLGPRIPECSRPRFATVRFSRYRTISTRTHGNALALGMMEADSVKVKFYWT